MYIRIALLVFRSVYCLQLQIFVCICLLIIGVALMYSYDVLVSCKVFLECFVCMVNSHYEGA